MYLRPGPSWRIDVRDPFDLFFAVYVAESLGLIQDEPVPRLSTPVPRWTPDVPAKRLNLVRAQWGDWWTALLADRSRQSGGAGDAGHVGAGVGAELRDAQQVLLSSARRWRAANEWRMSDSALMVPNEVVGQIEASTGRRARPFSYSLEVLPVAGAYVQDVSRDRALISESQCSDSVTLSAILRPRLEQLA